MSVENYSEKKEYSNLTPEQNKILSEINDILVFKDLDSWMDRQNKIITFIHIMEDKSITPTNYILGSRMVGGTPEPYVTEFDTKDQDIENFIRSLKK